MNQLYEFLNEKFPGLDLDSGLFYAWKPGIRFELGVSDSDVPIYMDKNYLQIAKRRAETIFYNVHSATDQLAIVCDVYIHNGQLRTPYAVSPVCKTTIKKSIL